MDNQTKAQKSFTLMEISVTVVILGMICSLALPRFIKLMGIAAENDALVKLKTIQTALISYYAQHTNYGGDGLLNVSAINTRFSTNISNSSGMTYTCCIAESSNVCEHCGPSKYELRAKSNQGWLIHFSQDDPDDGIHCWTPGLSYGCNASPPTANCPSCPLETSCQGY